MKLRISPTGLLIMTRFNLETLPLCGGKTRNGNKCKRKGSKHNGRCKLHGGKSTGAKTIKGKKAASLNARQRVPDWFYAPFHEQWLANPLFDEAVFCCQKLMSHQQYDPDTVNQMVERHQIALEVMKYAVLHIHGVDMFVRIQAALDHYYQDTNSAHIDFHIYYPLITITEYHRYASETQEAYSREWLGKKDFIRREMRKIEKQLEKIQSYTLP